MGFSGGTGVGLARGGATLLGSAGTATSGLGGGGAAVATTQLTVSTAAVAEGGMYVTGGMILLSAGYESASSGPRGGKGEVKPPKPKPGKGGGDGTRKKVSPETRKKVREEAGGRCVFCATIVSPKRGHVDHAISVAKGGCNDLENYQWTCPFCNLRKGPKTTNEYLEWLFNMGQKKK
jgi:hypothetical protein